MFRMMRGVLFCSLLFFFRKGKATQRFGMPAKAFGHSAEWVDDAAGVALYS